MKLMFEQWIAAILFCAITLSVISYLLAFGVYGSRSLGSAIGTGGIWKVGFLCFLFFLLGVAVTTPFPTGVRGLLTVLAAWFVVLAVQHFYATFAFGAALAIGSLIELVAIAVYVFPRRSAKSG